MLRESGNLSPKVWVFCVEAQSRLHLVDRITGLVRLVGHDAQSIGMDRHGASSTTDKVKWRVKAIWRRRLSPGITLTYRSARVPAAVIYSERCNQISVLGANIHLGWKIRFEFWNAVWDIFFQLLLLFSHIQAGLQWQQQFFLFFTSIFFNFCKLFRSYAWTRND